MQSFILAAALMGAAVCASVIPRQANTTVCGATSFIQHTIVDGDSLLDLASQYSSGVCDIAALNNITNPNLVILGQSLQIPVNCTTPTPDATCGVEVPADPTWTCVPGPPSTYDVREGDFLFDIATKFNITLDALVAANPQIENIDLIYPQQIINIPVCPQSQCTVETYNIRSGDIFYDLATSYGSTVGQILAFNVGVDPEKLEEGQQIILPWGCTNFTVLVL